MANANPYDDAITDELKAIAQKLKCELSGRTNDERAIELVSQIEDRIDAFEAELAELDTLRAAVKALM
jgi:ABC-type Fe3+-hydroxamate transport system substrate-binding protein